LSSRIAALEAPAPSGTILRPSRSDGPRIRRARGPAERRRRMDRAAQRKARSGIGHRHGGAHGRNL